jgi:alpha-glucosidase (family GH31 glycosyl hydrolase)
MQRNAAVAIWTGDISVSWEAFQQTPPTILRWTLAGALFIACDTGGFEGGAGDHPFHYMVCSFTSI